MQVVANSAQSYPHDERNASVLVSVNNILVARDAAMVSVFDAGFGLGDGVWEGIRLVNGRLIAIDQHIDRLFDGARSIKLDIGMTKSEVIGAIQTVLDANGMTDGVHIRIMVTRGTKSTVNQDPRFALGKPTIVIVAEYKARPDAARTLRLHTCPVRCSPADMFDMRLNSHSRLNLIMALLHAIDAGCDEALMLDPHGFVSSCNSTNFFIVRGRELWTSTGVYCFPGITRASVLTLASDVGMEARCINFSLADVYSADEAFVTGTLGGVTTVGVIDGRRIGTGLRGPMTAALADRYQRYLDGEA